MAEQFVIFWLTDIVGSTRKWETAPLLMGEIVHQHELIAEEVLLQHRGQLIKSKGEGDSLFAVFTNPVDAIVAAQEFVVKLSGIRWPNELSIEVRVGIHGGYCESRNNDYFGRTVNRAARIRSVANPSQILVSKAIAALVQDSLPDRITLKPLGQVPLKDLEVPQELFQVVGQKLKADFPELHGTNVVKQNLPQFRDPLIGRQSVVREIVAKLRQNAWVTLTGASGIGKSRLAVHAVAEDLELYPGGVHFLPLTNESSTSNLIEIIARHLRIQVQVDDDVFAQVVSALSGEKSLLLLDSTEHHSKEAKTVCEHLLDVCPNLSLLVASRQIIGSKKESVFRVPPLELPVPGANPHDSESVQLFISSASRTGVVTEDWSPAELSEIVTICQILDGLPLAIQLAASRASVITPGQILERLRSKFSIAVLSDRNSDDEKQKTLQSAIEWTFESMPSEEQAVFAILSLFRDGWSLETMEALMKKITLDPASMIGQLQFFDPIDLTEELQFRSLILVTSGDRQGARYRMLEPLRRFGEFKLDQLEIRSWATTFICDRMEYLVSEFDKNLQTVDGIGVLAYERANVEFAISVMVAERRNSVAQMAGKLGFFWDYFFDAKHGLEVVQDLLQDLALLDNCALSRLNAVAGLLSWRIGENETAKQYLASACKGLSEHDLQLGHNLNTLGLVLTDTREFVDSELALTRACRIFKQAGDLRGQGKCLNNLGRMHFHQDHIAEAEATWNECALIRRMASDQRGLSETLSNLGLVQISRKQFDTATGIFREAATAFGLTGQKISQAISLYNLGYCYLMTGDTNSARESMREALVLTKSLHNANIENEVHLGLARIGLEVADFDSVRNSLDAIRHSSRGVTPHTIFRTEVLLGKLAMDTNDTVSLKKCLSYLASSATEFEFDPEYQQIYQSLHI